MDTYSAWDLFRRGHLDHERHQKILREAVKKNLTDLISHGEIIAGENVKIPIRHLKQWRFVYEDPGDEGTVVLDGDYEEGDAFGKKPEKGQGGQGPGGGGESDPGYYEVVVDAEDVAPLLFEDLELPDLRQKEPKDAYKEESIFEGLNKKGIMPNLDKRRTIYQNIKRNASRGDSRFKDLADDDLRYRTEEIKKIPQDKVAVIFVRDRSASMGDEKKRLTRIAAFWIIKFLEHKYSKVVDKDFILFDTQADQVDEETFLGWSEGGGTEISSGLTLAKDVIEKSYPVSQYNTYTFLFTDGDNWSHDRDKALQATKDLLPLNNLFGCVYIDSSDAFAWAYGRGNSTYVQDIKELPLRVAHVARQENILSMMRNFFGKGGGEES